MTKRESITKRAGSLISSHDFACLLFVLLLLLTFLGTLEQVEYGLYATQRKYFASFLVVHRCFNSVPIPLPGGYLLLSLLALGTLYGGVARIRKDVRHLGALLIHIGAVALLAGAFVKHHGAEEGLLTLREGETGGFCESAHDWELVIWEDGAAPTVEYRVAEKEWNHAKPSDGVAFGHEGIPFEIEIVQALAHCVPVPTADARHAEGPVVGGYMLHPLREPLGDGERVPGVAVLTHGKEGAKPIETMGLLWGQQRAPFVVELEGRHWALDLRPRRRELPFVVRLDTFQRELHPGTPIPRTFRSEVTWFEGADERQAVIQMNEPLRHGGYTLYQASWGPQDAPEGTPLYSTLAVVRDPADWLPIWASVAMTLGMAIHYAMRFMWHSRKGMRGST